MCFYFLRAGSKEQGNRSTQQEIGFLFSCAWGLNSGLGMIKATMIKCQLCSGNFMCTISNLLIISLN